MNLDNTINIQPVPFVFPTVFSGTLLIMVVMYFMIIKFFESKGLIAIRNSQFYYSVTIAIVVLFVLVISLYVYGGHAPHYPGENNDLL